MLCRSNGWTVAPRRLVSADGVLDLPVTVTAVPDRASWREVIGPVVPDEPALDAALIAEAAGELEELERVVARAAPTRWPDATDRHALSWLGDMLETRRRGRIPSHAVARLAEQARRSPGLRGRRPDRRLGVRIDATVPAFDGEHSVRVVCADESSDGAEPVLDRWTRVSSDRAARRFTVVPRNGGWAPSLDVMVSPLPIRDLSARLAALAQDLATPSGVAVVPEASDGAITIALRSHPAAEATGELFAEDVTTRMRVEVAVDDGPFEPVGVGAVLTWAGSERSPLRFGSRHRFRVCPVDLAGNVVDGAESIVDAGRYLRREALDPPIIDGAADGAALRCVVRSDGDGTALGDEPAWIVARPHVAPATAARHGVEAPEPGTLVPGTLVPDPAAAGLAILGLNDDPTPVVVPYTGGAAKAPLRLVVRAAVADDVVDDSAVSIDHEPGSALVELLVPPAVEAEFDIASPVAGDALRHLHVGELPPATLLDGTALLRCRRRRVSVVHAVQRPRRAACVVDGPRLEPAPRRDDTAIRCSATFDVDGASTGVLHVDARWKDIVDSESGPLHSVAGSARLVSTTVGRRTDLVDLAVRHELHDTRRRTVTLRAIAVSRFGEHFDVDPSALERPGDELVVHVPNRGRPPVLPILASDDVGGPCDREVRVAIRRPWLATGDGELLGVVVRGPAAGAPWEVTSPASSWWELDDAIGSVDAGHVLAATDVVTAVPVPGAPSRSKVGVAGLPVRFDEALDQWVADIRLAVPERAVLHLALVRYQPLSVRGCHISAITEVVVAPRRVRTETSV